ncbi:MAG: DUF3025 domain-containing protein [Oligoflexus sp.]
MKHGDWPSRQQLSRYLEERGKLCYGQSFKLQFSPPPSFGKRRRRRLKQESAEAFAAAQYLARYETQIFEHHAIPHRLKNWHDLMNAAIWLRFPLSKLELHRQAYRLYQEELALLEQSTANITHLTGRSRRLDHLTCLDEGGIILLVPSQQWDEVCVEVASRDLLQKGRMLENWQYPLFIFGHGVWEELLAGVTNIQVMTLLVPWERPELGQTLWSNEDLLQLDRRLAQYLAATIDWSKPQEAFHMRFTGSLPLAKYRGIFAENTRQIDNGSSLMMP